MIDEKAHSNCFANVFNINLVYVCYMFIKK